MCKCAGLEIMFSNQTIYKISEQVNRYIHMIAIELILTITGIQAVQFSNNILSPALTVCIKLFGIIEFYCFNKGRFIIDVITCVGLLSFGRFQGLSAVCAMQWEEVQRKWDLWICGDHYMYVNGNRNPNPQSVVVCVTI